MTVPRLLVLRALLDEPECERYGLELAHLVGLEPGTIYPILVAFEAAGWLASRAEDEVDVRVEGRPRRRYYRLTAAGVIAGRAALTARPQRVPRPGARRLAW
ncbi:PadR family transcriptional regulator [Micromonospora sp. 067-2]|uniref:PadR family transcriptional regulator n=1 Tax=Micromonospora sp. 067-2 TaxID=2789270 RepID=UPI00397B5806